MNATFKTVLIAALTTVAVILIGKAIKKDGKSILFGTFDPTI
jgi:hypothetical protein